LTLGFFKHIGLGGQVYLRNTLIFEFFTSL